MIEALGYCLWLGGRDAQDGLLLFCDRPGRIGPMGLVVIVRRRRGAGLVDEDGENIEI